MNKNFIAVTKDPRWFIPTGILFLIPGAIAVIPFNADYIEVWDIPFYIIACIGVFLLVRSSQMIGWRLNLEDNVLYYQKFNLYSNWKERRSKEYALSIEKVSKAEYDGKQVVITYDKTKKLTFMTFGLDSLSSHKLEIIVRHLNQYNIQLK